MIRDALREFNRRRHVAIVLPRTMVEDTTVTDGLVHELVRELDRIAEAQQLPPDPDAGSLLEALSRALVWEEYPPATLSDLLAHEATFGRVVVLLASDLPECQQDELPELLGRLETGSRSVPTSERLTLIAIGHRGHLAQFAGGESTDVGLAAVWWWNRVARWDVAAHIAHCDDRPSGSAVLAEVRTETIVEVARWDLDLAEKLAASWSGDPSLIADWLDVDSPPACDPPEGPRNCGHRPSTAEADLWDEGHIDGWHESRILNARVLARSPERLERLVWAAQARILLPWIEERRAALYRRTVAALGEQAFGYAVEQFCSKQYNSSGLIEIGDLKAIVNARIGITDPWLRSNAHRLHAARNSLAHLEPLPYSELVELARTSEGLV